MPGVFCTFVLLISLFARSYAICEHRFGGSYRNIYIYENGTFRIPVEPIDATSITAIGIEDSTFGNHFKAAKNEADDKWVLEIKTSLTDWYDALALGSDPHFPLTITYTCYGYGYEYEHIISISGQNNRAPAFPQDSYESIITKLMPPDVPLHFVDTSLNITATDADFVCAQEDCNTDDNSNNIVATCIVEEDTEDVMNCEARKEEDSGLYRMFVSLKKSIDYMQDSSYAFKLKAEDGGNPALVSASVTVTLNFPKEDLNPPKFTKDFYSADKITTKHPYPFNIIDVEAHDGDDAINAEITYTVESISPSCDECFEFAGATLQQTKDLTQEMILARLVTVVVKATEETEEHRSSVVVVNIPIAVTTGGEYVSFTSMDANEDTQYVGYPGFIPLQNSAPMPITRVKATAFGWSNSQIIYSMKPHNKFFIDQASGEIFLVNNAGFGSIQTTCEQPCQLQVFADLRDLDVTQVTLKVQVSSLSESQILVLNSNSSYTDAETVLSSINSATDVDGKYWFRLVNIQAKEEGGIWQQKMVSPDKSVLFVTANKMDGKTFIEKEEASGIINGAAGADVDVDTTIQVNNQPEEPSGGGRNIAVIVLAVLLALVILAVLIAIFVIKRK